MEDNITGVVPLLALIGPTATGKTELALQLAQQLDGEIICADSRTIYRSMDIGTAKPSATDRQKVPHWGLDIVDPDESFTAAEYKAYANAAIADVAGSGKLPIMVGGSGMYIDAVLFDYQFTDAANIGLRNQLHGLSVAELQARVLAVGLELPPDDQNPRRLMRLLETGAVATAKDREKGMRQRTAVIGLDADIEVLMQRMAQRFEKMLEAGLVDEVAGLAKTYGWEVQSMQAPGYREFKAYFAGEQPLENTKLAVLKNTRALAKRQKTWFKRNKSIHWLTTEDKLAEAVDIATTVLYN